MKNEMIELSEYIRFLELYISDSIVFKVGNKPLKVAEIYEQLDKHRLDHKFYDKGQIRHFNQEKIIELKDRLKNLSANKKYQNLRAKKTKKNSNLQHHTFGQGWK